MDELWKKSQFRNQEIDFLFNTPIIEYDMKDAGFSLIKEYKLLPKMVIDHLETLPKENRKVQIGKYERDNAEFKQEFRYSFEKARKLFITENHLDIKDIICIKNDAIFTIGYVDHEKFGKIHFQQKHEYTSYIFLQRPEEKALELYYSPREFDIKGIGDDAYELHRDYMIDLLIRIFSRFENADTAETLKYINLAMNRYRELKWDIEYYREFNARSEFLYKDGTHSKRDYLNEKDSLDIKSNYQIFVSLTKIALSKG